MGAATLRAPLGRDSARWQVRGGRASPAERPGQAGGRQTPAVRRAAPGLLLGRCRQGEEGRAGHTGRASRSSGSRVFLPKPCRRPGLGPGPLAGLPGGQRRWRGATREQGRGPLGPGRRTWGAERAPEAVSGAATGPAARVAVGRQRARRPALLCADARLARWAARDCFAFAWVSPSLAQASGLCSVPVSALGLCHSRGDAGCILCAGPALLGCLSLGVRVPRPRPPWTLTAGGGGAAAAWGRSACIPLSGCTVFSHFLRL